MKAKGGGEIPVQLSSPSFTRVSATYAPKIQNNSNNGKFETRHGLYLNDTFIADITSIYGDYPRVMNDNSLATSLNLISGNYKVTAKNTNPVFTESEKSAAFSITVTSLSFTLEHCTISDQLTKMISWAQQELTLTPDSGYVLPDNIYLKMSDNRVYTIPSGTSTAIRQNPNSGTSSYETVLYDKTSGLLQFSFGNGIPDVISMEISCTARELVSGHTVTIYLDGSTFEYTMTNNSLSVDGVAYYLNGGVGDWETDYPDNGVQITASEVSISGYNFRWKDSDTSAWQYVEKTWTIPRDNYEIWIETAMDE